MNINTAGCDRRVRTGCILIIALTFHRLPRAVVYKQNVAETSYLHPAVVAACSEVKSYSIDAQWLFVDLREDWVVRGELKELSS